MRERPVINHALAYVNGNVHTNGMGDFLKPAEARSARHLGQGRAVPLVPPPRRTAFRYNHRNATDGERFSLALSGIVGKRVMYADLTGKSDESLL